MTGYFANESDEVVWSLGDTSVAVSPVNQGTNTGNDVDFLGTYNWINFDYPITSDYCQMTFNVSNFTIFSTQAFIIV